MKIRIKTSFKNNIIFKRRKLLQMGQIEYSKFLNISVSYLQIIENLSEHKRATDGFINAIKIIALDCDCNEEDIWPEWLYFTGEKKDIKEIEVTVDQFYIEQKKSDAIEIFDKRKNILNRAIKYLPERSQEIIKMRYGFKPYEKPHTLEEIAKKLNYTRERIRQIEYKSYRVMKRKMFQHEELDKLQLGDLARKQLELGMGI